MKKIPYLLAIVIFCACNNHKTETTQPLTLTPTGIEGLKKQEVAVPPTMPSKSNLIFNPPHGTAGHTCALAVGAPLNQTAAIQPQASNAVQASTAKPIAITSSTKRNINPKHGEPNHRCDIAVGAPLDSKPIIQPKAITVQPSKTNPTESKTLEAQNGIKINPKHGDAGHRCDIAIGAPLT